MTNDSRTTRRLLSPWSVARRTGIWTSEGDDRKPFDRRDRECLRQMIAMSYRQLSADEAGVSYLYGRIAQQERSPERRVLFQQMSVRAADAAERYAQRGGTRTVPPSISTRFWIWCVMVFGYSAAFQWIERIERRETRLKATLLRILLRVCTGTHGRTENVVAFKRPPGNDSQGDQTA
jgi:hypothetical protein